MKISILTPCLNSAAYLERAIRSVVAQNDSDFEHVVVDGGSTDGTVTILKQYPHLRWISEPDQGQTHAMNKAFAMSRGDVVTYLNSDDWFEPGVFVHLRDCWTSDPQADMVIGNFYWRYAYKTTVRLMVPKKDYCSTLLFFQNVWPLNPVCYFYRRAVQASMGDIPADVGFGRDYWFLIRAMAKARIHPSDLVFGTYFFHPGSETVRKSRSEEGDSSCRRWVREHLREANPRLLAWWTAHWWWHRYVRQFPEPIKVPFRYLAYKVLFASQLDYDEFRSLGFRKCWRQQLRKG